MQTALYIFASIGLLYTGRDIVKFCILLYGTYLYFTDKSFDAEDYR